MSTDVMALGREGHKFTNWTTSYTCQPELYFEPETTEEITKILTSARQKGKQVKVAGKGHSFSDLVCTPHYLICLCRYNKVLKVDKERQQVTVQGGCVASELNTTILPAHGLALRVQGVISDVTVAGMISTGTHGTGADYGTSSSIVVSLDLMTASGEIMHISKEENSELMPAAVLSLGALGVILSVTLQCEPAFRLLEKRYPAKLQDVLDNLDQWLTSTDHFHIELFPYADGVICQQASHTTQEPKDDTQSTFASCAMMVLGFVWLSLIWLSSFWPGLIPTVSRCFYRFVYSRATEKVAPSHKVICMDFLPNHDAMEWAIPREKLGVVLKEFEGWLTKSGFPAHFPIVCRFGKSEDIYLSPAYGTHTCYINLLMLRPFNKQLDCQPYWDAFEGIVSPHGGRPHWAKDHPYGRKDLEKLYPKWAEFCTVRQQLDPNGMFFNSHLQRILSTHTASSETSV